MRVISLHQPYASLIMMGLKKHETRHWRPPEHYIGERMGIHAAKKVWRYPDIPLAITQPFTAKGPYRPPQGCLLGSVLLAEVYQSTHARKRSAELFDVLAGDWEEGRWLWRLEDPRPLAEPIVMRGFQKWSSYDMPEGS